MNTDTTVPPVFPGLFSEDADSPCLTGSECVPCGRRFYPRRRFCDTCLEPATDADLGAAGTLFSFTIIRTKPPYGLPAPYAVGYVDLADGPRVFSLLDPDKMEGLEIGMPLALRVGTLGDDGHGQPCRRPYFTPAGGA